jgi:hypothetical protein
MDSKGLWLSCGEGTKSDISTDHAASEMSVFAVILLLAAVSLPYVFLIFYLFLKVWVVRGTTGGVVNPKAFA